MFVIAIVDLFALQFVGLFTAILGIKGTVFCAQPKLIYIVGCVLQGRKDVLKNSY
jgi:hypothetical protein